MFIVANETGVEVVVDVTDSPVFCPLPWHLVVFQVVGPQASLEMLTAKSLCLVQLGQTASEN